MKEWEINRNCEEKKEKKSDDKSEEAQKLYNKKLIHYKSLG